MAMMGSKQCCSTRRQRSAYPRLMADLAATRSVGLMELELAVNRVAVRELIESLCAKAELVSGKKTLRVPMDRTAKYMAEHAPSATPSEPVGRGSPEMALQPAQPLSYYCTDFGG